MPPMKERIFLALIELARSASRAMYRALELADRFAPLPARRVADRLEVTVDGGRSMIEVTVRQGRAKNVTVSAKAGNDVGAYEGEVRRTPGQEGIVEFINVQQNGEKFAVKGVNLGSVDVLLEADKKLGDGEEFISQILRVNVIPLEAETLEVSVDDSEFDPD